MPLSPNYRNPYSESTAPALQTKPDSYFIKETLVSKLEIHIACNDLRDRDYLSKSDPLVVVFVQIPRGDRKVWKEYDRTETMRNDLNPRFVKPIIIEYYFEVYQKLKFEVYDKDAHSDSLHLHDFLGSVEVSLGSIVGEHGGAVKKNLYGKRKQKLKATISFIAEELFDTKEMLTLKFRGQKLDKKDLFSSSDPFLVISRVSLESNVFLPVYKTETIKNNNNPMWKQFTIPVSTICNGDKDRTIRIECFDAGSKRTLIGSLDTSVNDLLENSDQKMMLMNSKKSLNKQSGYLKILYIELESKPSFLDYVSSGLDLCFHVAIDFTASNGNPAQPSSLHYQGDENQYVQALINVGQICEDYDTDKLIPAFGFGAKVKGQISHDFPLNFSQDPNCSGIEGVVNAYQNALHRIEFFGPTNFSPIINKVSRIAEEQSNFDKYHILLILTDGMISDMGLTKKALIRASKLPISVIIVGVGNNNFDSMVELDGDTGLLEFQDMVAERDIVQFVSYQDFSGCFAAVDLAQEVLYEVPHQLTNFMERNGIAPGGESTKIVYGGEKAPSAPMEEGDHLCEEKSNCNENTDDVSGREIKDDNTGWKKMKSRKKKKKKDKKEEVNEVRSQTLPFQKRELTAKEYALQFLQKSSQSREENNTQT